MYFCFGTTQFTSDETRQRDIVHADGFGRWVNLLCHITYVCGSFSQKKHRLRLCKTPQGKAPVPYLYMADASRAPIVPVQRQSTFDRFSFTLFYTQPLPPVLHPPSLLTAFDNPFQLTSRPPTIKFPRLRHDLFALDKAFPWPSIEANETFQVFEPRCRILVGPDSVLNGLGGLGGGGEGNGVVCCPSFPFAES